MSNMLASQLFECTCSNFLGNDWVPFVGGSILTFFTGHLKIGFDPFGFHLGWVSSTSHLGVHIAQAAAWGADACKGGLEARHGQRGPDCGSLASGKGLQLRERSSVHWASLERKRLSLSTAYKRRRLFEASQLMCVFLFRGAEETGREAFLGVDRGFKFVGPTEFSSCVRHGNRTPLLLPRKVFRSLLKGLFSEPSREIKRRFELGVTGKCQRLQMWGAAASRRTACNP